MSEVNLTLLPLACREDDRFPVIQQLLADGQPQAPGAPSHYAERRGRHYATTLDYSGKLTSFFTFSEV